MSIIGVGNPTPSQGDLLRLAGCVIGGRERILSPSEQQIAKSKKLGLEGLRKLTGKDFGYDVKLWLDYLVSEDEFSGILHPFGFRSMKRIVEELGFKVPYEAPEC